MVRVSMKPTSILFVCIGNTCRSPMAEALARRKWPSSEIKSVGTGVAEEGLSAADEAVTVMSSLGIDIRDHKVTSISSVDVDSFQVILALDKDAKRSLIQNYGVSEHKISDLFVEDPFGSDLERYHRCAEQIQKKLGALSFKNAAL